MGKNKDIDVKKGKPPVGREEHRFLTPFEEMEQLMEGLFRSRWPRFFHGEWPSWPEMSSQLERPMPRVDVVDEEEQMVVTAEIPGAKKEDLDVSVVGNRITIKGVTSHEEKSEKGDYFRREISRGEFSRTIALPAEVDLAKVKAAFENGVLTVTLPKLEQAKRLNVKVE